MWDSTSVTGVSEDVMKRFLAYNWPGNIRELKNTLYYAATMASTELIDESCLPTTLAHPATAAEARNIREDQERNLIISVLYYVNHNKKQAAEILKMSRNTLYNKLKKYRIDM
jgi:two-component system response regulator HydG